MLSTVALYGMLEVGATLANPCGDEGEDFAVLSFLENTVCAHAYALRVHCTRTACIHALFARAGQADGSRRVLDTPSLLRTARPSDRVHPRDVGVEVGARGGGGPAPGLP